MPRFLPGSGADGPAWDDLDGVGGPAVGGAGAGGAFGDGAFGDGAFGDGAFGDGDVPPRRTRVRDRRGGRRRSERRPSDRRPPTIDHPLDDGDLIDPGLGAGPREPGDDGRPYGWPKRVYWRIGHARIDGQRQRVYVPVAPPLATQERYRGPRLDRNRWLKVVVSLGVFLALVLGVYLWASSWWHRQLDPPGAPGAEVTFEIPSGAGRNEIASILKDNGIITSEWAFRWYLDRKGVDNIQPGTYTLRERSSAWDIVDALRAPDTVVGAPTYTLVIPEGFNLNQIADRVAELPIPGISRDRFLEAARSGAVRSRFQPGLIPSVEGLVFPATYDIGADWDEQRILKRLVDEFDARAEALGMVPGEDVNGVDPYDIVKIASLIESEAKLAEDRPLISQVIHNRLGARQKLQIDATVLYARDQAGLPRTDQLTLADLAMDSPWNTYFVDGLPFTPISAPGEASLQAAMEPAPGTYRYYVLTSADGKHSFATSFEEFEALRQQAVRDGIIPG
jgi:UPF0755 protein